MPHFTDSQDYEQYRQDNPDDPMSIYKGKREHLPWLQAVKPVKNLFGFPAVTGDAYDSMTGAEKDKWNEDKIKEMGL